MGEKLFAFFGKLIFIFLLIGGLGYGGYYVGTHFFGSRSNTAAQVTASPTNTPGLSQAPTSALSPTPGSKKVQAGIKTPAFSPYTITVLAGWTDTHSADPSIPLDKLILSKGDYSLTISQAGGGAGSCTFPGDAQEPMAQSFTSFVSISNPAYQFRRGTADGITFTVCEKKPGGYGFPTSFGYITYSTPKNPDLSLMTEMDGMIATLTK